MDDTIIAKKTNVLKKAVFSLFAAASVDVSAFILATNRAVKAENICTNEINNDKTDVATQDNKQDARQLIREQLNFVSSAQVTEVSHVINCVFYKHIMECDLKFALFPIFMNDKACLISIYYIPSVESGKEMREFETC